MYFLASIQRQIPCCCKFPKTISVFGFSSSFGFVVHTLCVDVVLFVTGSLDVCAALMLFLTVILAPCHCGLIRESVIYSRICVSLKFMHFFFTDFVDRNSAWQCVLGRTASEACFVVVQALGFDSRCCCSFDLHALTENMH